LGWINNQKILLEECLRKLKEGYSYASIIPVIREIYENFWFIHLAMNGIKHYKYFRIKKGHDITKIYNKWKKDLEVRMPTYHKTYQTIIKTIIKNGFEIIDYKDCFPSKQSKKLFPKEYEDCSKIPFFLCLESEKKMKIVNFNR